MTGRDSGADLAAPPGESSKSLCVLTTVSTDTAIYIGIVYSYLPFMVLPLYASLEKTDETLLEAAADLGCPWWKAFWLVTVPLSGNTTSLISNGVPGSHCSRAGTTARRILIESESL